VCVYLVEKENRFSVESILDKKLSFSNLLVCIVEDNPANMELMSEYLESLGIKNSFKFDTALDCLNFLELSQKEIDLFLLDLSLPGMDGFKLLEHIKKLEMYASSVCIAVSDMVLPDQVQKIKDSMFCNHIKKPVCFDGFSAVSKVVLNKLELQLKGGGAQC